MTIASETREERIEFLADAMIEVALYEALSMGVGTKYILAAIPRLTEVIKSMDAVKPKYSGHGAHRLNELRAWLGMVTRPDAVADANSIGEPRDER